jgi:hypothetical protein
MLSDVYGYGEHSSNVTSPPQNKLSRVHKRFVRAMTEEQRKPSRILNSMIDQFQLSRDFASCVLPQIQRVSARHKNKFMFDSASISTMNKILDQNRFDASLEDHTPFAFGYRVCGDGSADVGNGSDSDPLVVGFSSAYMISRLILARDYMLHIDGTFKIDTHGFPVLVVGVSDTARHFHPVALFLVSQTTQPIFELALDALLTEFEEVTGKRAVVGQVMGDADKAQWNALDAVISSHQAEPWEYAMCFFHVMKNVKDRVRSLDASDRDLVFKHVYKMHYSRSSDTFEWAWQLACHEWCSNLGTRSFADYFYKQWIVGCFHRWQCYWSRPGQAKTNNPVEQFNRELKSDYTQHTLLSPNMLVHELLRLCRHHSVRVKPFEERPHPASKQLSNYRRLKQKKCLSVLQDGWRVSVIQSAVYINKSDCVALSNIDALVDRDDMKALRKSIRIHDFCMEVHEQPHGGWNVSGDNFACDCNACFKFGYCVHIIAARAFLNLPVVGLASNRDTFVNRRKQSRKRGRPGQVGDALSFE